MLALPTSKHLPFAYGEASPSPNRPTKVVEQSEELGYFSSRMILFQVNRHLVLYYQAQNI